MINYKEYKKLVEEVNRLRNEVHLFNNEEISESALDDLKHKITLFEEKYPEKVSSQSPNYKVSGGTLQGFKKFEHKRRMLSLNDIFSEKELQEWQARWQKFIKSNDESWFAEEKENFLEEYYCEPKLDGLAVALHYENGELVNAVTRGDGFVGEDVLENIQFVKSIPKNIPDLRKIEVRGEVFMSKKDFRELNQEISEGKKVGKMGKTGPEAVFANPRNAASGTLRQLNSRILGERNLDFIAYNAFIF